MPTYTLTKPFYSSGHLYSPGEKITVPEGTKVASSWVPDEPSGAVEEDKPKRGRKAQTDGARASDMDPGQSQ